MAWNNPVINGTNSVASNKTPLNENSDYIETTMQQDHYWDENANLDGRHKQVNMVDASPDPTIGTDCDGTIFLKEIDKDGAGLTESVAVHKNSGSVNYLGIRAWVHFNGRVGNGNCTINAQYNVSGVTRSAAGTGEYTITFTSALPTRFYVISGTATGNTENFYISPRVGNQASLQTVNFCQISVLRGTTRTEAADHRITVMIVGG